MTDPQIVLRYAEERSPRFVVDRANGSTFCFICRANDARDKCEAIAFRMPRFRRFRSKTAPDQICRAGACASLRDRLRRPVLRTTFFGACAPMLANDRTSCGERARVDDKSGRAPVCVRLCRLRIKSSQTLPHYQHLRQTPPSVKWLQAMSASRLSSWGTPAMRCFMCRRCARAAALRPSSRLPCCRPGRRGG